MPTLNPIAKDVRQELVKTYLEQNVSNVLADKINNGVRIQKDGKTLISKKTLDGFNVFSYQTVLSDKKYTKQDFIFDGKPAKGCVLDDSDVFNLAIHYFEEDSIEGTLYNEDGTEYKPPKPVTPPKPATTYTPPKPQTKPQMSLFELMENNANEEKPSENAQDVSQKAVQPTRNRLRKNCERLPKRRKTYRCLQCPKKRKPFRCRARPSISGICRYRISIQIISSCSAAEISMRRSAKAHRYSRKISRLPSRAGIAGFWSACP